MTKERLPEYSEREFLAACARSARLFFKDDPDYDHFMDVFVNRCSEQQWERAQPFLKAVEALGKQAER